MQTSYDKENVVYAGFFSRLAAFVLDSILVSIGLCIIKLPVWFIELSVGDSVLFRPILFEYTIFDIIYYLLTVAYFVLTTYYCGATVGKYLMKLKVVDLEGQKLGFVTVLIRETVGRYLSALIIYIGYIIVGVDNRKQGLHDKIADTCVIYRQSPVKKQMQPVRPVQAVPNVSFPQVGQQNQSPEANFVGEFHSEAGMQQKLEMDKKVDLEQKLELNEKVDLGQTAETQMQELDLTQKAELKKEEDFSQVVVQKQEAENQDEKPSTVE